MDCRPSGQGCTLITACVTCSKSRKDQREREGERQGKRVLPSLSSKPVGLWWPFLSSLPLSLCLWFLFLFGPPRKSSDYLERGKISSLWVFLPLIECMSLARSQLPLIGSEWGHSLAIAGEPGQNTKNTLIGMARITSLLFSLQCPLCPYYIVLFTFILFYFSPSYFPSLLLSFLCLSPVYFSPWNALPNFGASLCHCSWLKVRSLQFPLDIQLELLIWPIFLAPIFHPHHFHLSRTSVWGVKFAPKNLPGPFSWSKVTSRSVRRRETG